MTDDTLRAIGELLESGRATGSFAVRRTAAPGSLAIEVAGTGAIALPVTATQARELCAVARPARFGLREQTLLDPNVRHTWEIPRDRVTVDAVPAALLATLRDDLGLPASTELTAELHSMLVYEPGQFFLRHQDSEKAGGMVGTLVVSLPSEFSGGELVVEHQGQRVVDGGSPTELSLTAFYTDCAHEVLPVTQGYRIALTYNLIATGRDVADEAVERVDELAELLEAHLTTPRPALPWNPPENTEPAPARLVYFLDHQYTRRGLGWDQLKGVDAGRVTALAQAADRAGYECALALAEIQESFDIERFEDEEWLSGRTRRWERVDGVWQVVDEDWEAVDDEEEPYEDETVDSELPADHPDTYRPDELDDPWTAITLTWWIDRSGRACEPVEPAVTDSELCANRTVPQPFAFESQGFLGNEGNTVDRWYRRAALVVRGAQQ